MDIYFRTKKLQKICSEEKEMQKQLGMKCAEKLKQRMMELKAADALSDISHLPPSRCHELSGKRARQFSVDIEQPYRLLFVPTNNPIPRLKDGGIDKQRVTEIEIIEITDTH
ncbi:MAG: type II toxin-antitoxin system RelE/ParE family toxin [Deltaproteobacteria bacterium]|nr:type II toxin-antitoxin system RelE/ParE family toxin [Deltaproteobacteria bacterium]